MDNFFFGGGTAPSFLRVWMTATPPPPPPTLSQGLDPALMDALGKFGALKKLELLSPTPQATLSCSPNFPRASITRYKHAKSEQILRFYLQCVEIAYAIVTCASESDFNFA